MELEQYWIDYSLESFINIKFGDIYIPVIIIRDCTNLTNLQICIKPTNNENYFGKNNFV